MIIMPTRVAYETLPGEKCARWTIEVQRWTNVVDRPVRDAPRLGDLPEDVRAALLTWLNAEDWRENAYQFEDDPDNSGRY
jgi:hypothetical protein